MSSEVKTKETGRGFLREERIFVPREYPPPTDVAERIAKLEVKVENFDNQIRDVRSTWKLAIGITVPIVLSIVGAFSVGYLRLADQILDIIKNQASP